MKFIIVLACVVAVVYGEYKVTQEFKDKNKEEYIKVGEKCAKIENASEADIKEYNEVKIPSTKEGKCMLACMHQEFGAQYKDGKFTKEGLIKSVETYKEANVDFYNDVVKVLVDVCLPQVKSSDRCEAALELDECYVTNASEDIRNAEGI